MILSAGLLFSGLAAAGMSGDLAAELKFTGTYILTATPVPRQKPSLGW